MLVEGDHVWHPGHQWFHRCTVDATCPPAASSTADSNSMLQVAKDTVAARDWNPAKREAAMA